MVLFGKFQPGFRVNQADGRFKPWFSYRPINCAEPGSRGHRHGKRTGPHTNAQQCNKQKPVLFFNGKYTRFKPSISAGLVTHKNI